ncbi:TolC family protein [Porticoccaceae bacterium LTM1]|nr:TolC family protein [Porticoccaceae bacterium LTM1]
MKIKLLSIATALAISANSHGESLADIYELALANDPTYQQAVVEYKIGQRSNYKAWANFLPKLNIDPSGSYSEGTGATFRSKRGDDDWVTNEGKETESKSASIGRLTFNLGINDWFTFQNSLMNDDEAKYRFAQAQQNLIISVTNKYFSVLKAYDQLRIAQKSQELSRINLELAQTQLDQGLNTITDLHSAKADFYSKQISTQDAQVAFDQAFEALSLLTGKAHYELEGFEEKIPSPAPSPSDPESWINEAMSSNYNLKLDAITREKARNTRQADKLFYLPRVNMSWGGQSYNSTPGTSSIEKIPVTDENGDVVLIEQQITSPSQRNLRRGGESLTVNLNIPLFGDNGLSWIQRKENAEREQIAQENFIKSRRQTEFDIRSNFLSILSQQKRLELQEMQLEQSQLAYEKTLIEYEHGSKSMVDLLQQQTNLMQSEKSNSDTRFQYIEQLLRLKQDAGKLTPADIYEIDSWLSEDAEIIATQRTFEAAASQIESITTNTTKE